MSEERRKGDRRIPPAVAQHLVEERGGLLARIAELESERNRLLNNPRDVFKKMCDMALKQRDEFAAELAALKAHPSAGVVLPEPFDVRPFQTIDRGSVNYMAGFNAAIRKMRESVGRAQQQKESDDE